MLRPDMAKERRNSRMPSSLYPAEALLEVVAEEAGPPTGGAHCDPHAVRLYHTEQVAYTCGTRLYRLFGGTNARSGLRTIVEVNSIIATIGHTHNPGNLRNDYTPPLNNQTLFSGSSWARVSPIRLP